MSADRSDDIHQQLWAIGYGRPPEHSRFRKGQSGNPQGRPKKASSELPLSEQPLLEEVLKAAARKVTRRENGKAEEISLGEAVVHATLAGAAKGNPRSQALALKLMRDANDTRAREIRETNMVFEWYKERKSAELAEAAERGLPPPKILPHPDDIAIDQLKGPRFLGPLDEQDQAKLENILRCRDVLVMQEALDRRTKTRLNGTSQTEPGSAILLALVIDSFAPKRLRLSEDAWASAIMHYETVPKRQLLKLVYAAWRDLGVPLPRGYVMPNQSWTRARLALLFDLYREGLSGRLDLDAMAEGEWDEPCREIFAKHGLQV